MQKLARLFMMCLHVLDSVLAKSGVQLQNLLGLAKAERSNPSNHSDEFPEGVLNTDWANNPTHLKAIRQSLKVGKPVVIEEFLSPQVAETLFLHLDSLASQQQDIHNHTGYPFSFVSQGPWSKVPRNWTGAGQLAKGICQRLVEERTKLHAGAFVQANHKLSEVGSSAELMSAFQFEMERPGPKRLWAGLVGLPRRAQDFAGQWTWFRKDDFYNMHEDVEPFRYLSITLQLTRDWPSGGGGENVWCGAERGSTDISTTIGGVEQRYAKDGTPLSPGFNQALVFPVSRLSSHAVVPVQTETGRRFTLQGWYTEWGVANGDPGALSAYVSWVKHWETKPHSLQPPAQIKVFQRLRSDL